MITISPYKCGPVQFNSSEEAFKALNALPPIVMAAVIHLETGDELLEAINILQGAMKSAQGRAAIMLGAGMVLWVEKSIHADLGGTWRMVVQRATLTAGVKE